VFRNEVLIVQTLFLVYVSFNEDSIIIIESNYEHSQYNKVLFVEY